MGEKRRFRLFVISVWQPATLGLLAIATIIGLLTFHIGSLTTHLSSPEVDAINHSQNVHNILDNPLNAPHSLVQYGLHLANVVSPLSMRLVSAGFGLMCVGFFFYTVRHWYTVRIGLLTTLLFASSSWFLHSARLSTPLILQSSLVIALAYGTWLKRTRTRTIATLAAVLLLVWFMYIPGFVWFVLLALVWQRKSLRMLMERTPVWGVMMAYAIGVLLLAPLVRAFVLNPELLKSFAGLPLDSLPTPVSIVKNLLSVPEQLVFRGPDSSLLWLGRMPLLDIFSVSMLALGVYSINSKRSLDRVKVIVGGCIVGTLLVGLGGVVNIVVLLPLLFAVMAGGIALMLRQWFTVFPRNPLARSIGGGLLIIAVLLTVFYNINHYFIAWPNAPITKQTFTSEIH